MTPEIADKLMAFLNEMTEEGGDDEATPGAVSDAGPGGEGGGGGGAPAPAA